MTRLSRIFSTTPAFHVVVLQYADPKDVVFIFDTTFGTNIYGMSLGFFVCPDMHGRSQVVAFTMLQHEDQLSLNFVFASLRIAMNGGVEGEIVPGLIMSDGCGKLFKAIYTLNRKHAILRGGKTDLGSIQAGLPVHQKNRATLPEVRHR